VKLSPGSLSFLSRRYASSLIAMLLVAIWVLYGYGRGLQRISLFCACGVLKRRHQAVLPRYGSLLA
jgi:hypothetical protein